VWLLSENVPEQFQGEQFQGEQFQGEQFQGGQFQSFKRVMTEVVPCFI
jgi:hypothetical protein